MRTADCRRVKSLNTQICIGPSLDAKLSSLRESFAFRQGVKGGESSPKSFADFLGVMADRVEIIFITSNAVGKQSDKYNRNIFCRDA